MLLSKKLILVILLLFSFEISFGQNYSEQAKLKFSKFHNIKDLRAFCLKSIPKLEDCKLVFQGQNAYTYFGYAQDMLSKIDSAVMNTNDDF